MNKKNRNINYLLEFGKISLRWKGILIFIIISGFISTLVSVYAPNYLGDATDLLEDYINNGFSQEIWDSINLNLLIALLLYCFSNFLTYFQNQKSVVLSQKISYYLRDKMNNKIPNLPYMYFETKQVGDIMSRFTNDIDLIGENLPSILIDSVSFVISVVGISIFVIIMNATIGMMFILLLLLSIVIVAVIIKFSQPYYTSQQKVLGDLNGFINESYEGHDSIVTYNAEKAFKKKFINLNNNLYKVGFMSSFLSSFVVLVNNLFYLGAFSFVVVFGVKFTIDGSLTLGELQTLLIYTFLIEIPLSQISTIVNLFQQIVAAGKRVIDFLDEEEINKKSWLLSKNDIVNYNINIQDLFFSYKKNTNILNKINVDIPFGQKVAIVGPTGSGKSTIVKLLLGFYDNYEGSIKLGNCEINKLDHSDLRSIVGIVAQDVWLQSGTIAENISLKSDNDEINSSYKIVQASKISYAEEVIYKFKDNYNHMIDDTQDILSTGELQLINIARVFYSDKKIIIFDEATSYVDTKTEKMLQNAINNLAKDKTLIMIAHRLSTIVDCDKILYIENGEIKESGSHKELLNKKGYYYNLYNSQY